MKAALSELIMSRYFRPMVPINTGLRTVIQGDSIRIDSGLYYYGTDQPSPLPTTGAMYSWIVGVMKWEGRNSLPRSSTKRGWILQPRFASDLEIYIPPVPNVVDVWSVNSTTAAVKFDRTMQLPSAGNFSTYNGLSILGVSLDTSGTIAFLTTAVQPNNTVDTMFINGVCGTEGGCMTTPAHNKFRPGFTDIAIVNFPEPAGDSSAIRGDIVTVKAVVVADTSECYASNTSFINDQSGPPNNGVELFNPTPFRVPPVTGDTIIVTGKVLEYFGQTEVSASAYLNLVTLSAGPSPIPSTVTIPDLLANSEGFESSLITLCDSFVVTNIAFDAFGFQIQSLTNPTETIVIHRQASHTRYTYVPVLGDIFRGITGVYRMQRSLYRLMPRSNDDFNTSATWCATGEAEVGVTPASLHHYQETNINRTFAGDFTISNTGTIPLTFTASNTLSWITIGTLSGNVPAGGSQPIDLTVNTIGIAVGVYNDFITISSNDPITPAVDLPVTISVSQVVPGVDHFDINVAEGQISTTDLTISNGAAVDVRIDLTAIPTEWLSVVPGVDTIPAGGNVTAVVSVNAAGLPEGVYTGTITINSSNLMIATIIEIPVNVTVTGPVCSYVVGDANNSNTFNGLDVTYSVNYFRGGDPPAYSCECTPGNIWFVSGDVNGSCSFNGLDVTYMVNYFKGGAGPIPCADCPPGGRFAPNSGNAPAVQPIIHNVLPKKAGSAE